MQPALSPRTHDRGLPIASVLAPVLAVVMLSAGGLEHAPPAATSATLIHVYDLKVGYRDFMAGPSLVPLGGSIGATGYAFGPNQGLTLSNALPNPGDYSIEMRFQIATTTSWRKLIDFNNLSVDEGLYNKDSALQFYGSSTATTGPQAAIPNNTMVELLLTREQATNRVVGFINGVRHIAFSDLSGDGIFAAAQNVITFFVDDLATSQTEASAGVVEWIKIYDGPLDSPKVQVQGAGCGTPTPILDASPPIIGEVQTYSLSSAPVNAPVTLLIAPGPASPVALGRCLVQPSLRLIVFVAGPKTSATGTWTHQIAIPNLPGMIGGVLTTQALTVTAGGPLLGLAMLSNGLEMAPGY